MRPTRNLKDPSTTLGNTQRYPAFILEKMNGALMSIDIESDHTEGGFP